MPSFASRRPLEGILAQARESGAELIVMGTHGRTGFRRLIIGSVTETVMRKSELPVIAVPPGGDAKPDMNTIICPAFYNDQCRDALLFAAAMTSPHAKIIITRPAPDNDVFDTADALFTLRAWVPESIAARCELKIFGSGHMAGQVEGFAQKVEADLIVAAEPLDRSAADHLYGTFAARLIRHSDCPVLTMNHPAAKRVARVAERERLTDVVWANQ
jgi:nucleotide-binding universal stress UspA family protein